MNIAKLFRISGGICQEFWMLCAVKLNIVTQNTQTRELQSTAGSPSLDTNPSGSMSIAPTLWRALEPSVWFQASVTKVPKSQIQQHMIWTNA